MLIEDVINGPVEHEKFHVLKERCSQYIEESNSLPLLKNLSCKYSDLQKVKVRRKKGEQFDETFNEAFGDKLRDLRQRAIFSNGEGSFITEGENLEPFYIFPINGYQFLYSKEVTNSCHSYKAMFDSVFETFGMDEGSGIITSVLRFNYTSENLIEGINSGAEIICYNVPFYYAVRKYSVDSYDQLLTAIQSS